MASRKRTRKPNEQVSVDTRTPSVPVVEIDDGRLRYDSELVTDDLLKSAESAIRGVEARMLALTVAATERWVPNQNAYETDEVGSAVFGDDEYNEFLLVVEEIGHIATVTAVAKFFGVPGDTVEALSLDLLRESFLTSGPSRAVRGANQTVVSKVGNRHD